MDDPEIRKWTVQRAKTDRSKGVELNGLKRGNWTVKRGETGRSKRIKRLNKGEALTGDSNFRIGCSIRVELFHPFERPFSWLELGN